MAEYTYATVQAVASGQNVLFSDVPVPGGCCVIHRDGSGIVTLRGSSSGRRVVYRVSFGANIAVPSDGTAGEISVSLALGGESMESARAIVTPAAAGEYQNVYVSANVSVPAACCAQVSVQNTSGTDIDVRNANLIVERVIECGTGTI